MLGLINSIKYTILTLDWYNQQYRDIGRIETCNKKTYSYMWKIVSGEHFCSPRTLAKLPVPTGL